MIRRELDLRISVLIGKTLWDCQRAADLAMFSFGPRIATTNFRGEPKTVGEYALHVQCPWSLSTGEKIVVGSQDLYYPVEDVEGSDFDWQTQPNRLDSGLKTYFSGGGSTVLSTQWDSRGNLNLELDGDGALRLFVADSIPHEQWRLLRPGSEEPHVVCYGNKIDIE